MEDACRRRRPDRGARDRDARDDDRPVDGAGGAERFRTWLDRHRPDVVFTLYNSVFAWLKAAGRKIPEGIGVIQLEWRASRPDIAGMNQHNFVTGEAAVDMVVGQVHNNETGIQEFPRSTMIGATWVGGSTVRIQGQRKVSGRLAKVRRA